MSSIKQAAEEMLLQTIIPFWKGLRDEENGGFLRLHGFLT